MTADGPSHQQPRTNKRKARSDVSLVLIRRVNLALGLMGGSQRSPLGPPSGSGLRVTQRGPGRAGWGQRAAPSPSVLRFTPSRSPTSSLSHGPWRAASTSPSGTLRSGGGEGEVSPIPSNLPSSRITLHRGQRLAWAGHWAHARAHAHTQAHARPALALLRGGPIRAGQRHPPCCPISRPLGPGPQVLQPTLDAPVSAVVKEDERAAWAAPRGQAGLLRVCSGHTRPQWTLRQPVHRQAPSPWAATSPNCPALAQPGRLARPGTRPTSREADLPPPTRPHERHRTEVSWWLHWTEAPGPAQQETLGRGRQVPAGPLASACRVTH